MSQFRPWLWWVRPALFTWDHSYMSSLQFQSLQFLFLFLINLPLHQTMMKHIAGAHFGLPCRGAPWGVSLPIQVPSSVLRDLVFETHSITCGSNDLDLVVPWHTFSVFYCQYLSFLCILYRAQVKWEHDTTWLQAQLGRIYPLLWPDCTLSLVPVRNANYQHKTHRWTSR